MKRCIFCGKNGNLSKEHFWPSWMRAYFPRGDCDSYVTTLFKGEGPKALELQKESERQGQVITKKVRVVCRSCNSGWMSRLETRVKPTMEQFFEARSTVLDTDQANYFALWVTVKTVIGEHAEVGTALTPEQDRELLFKEEKIPDYFRIYLGFHSSRTRAGYQRHSLTASRDRSGPNPPLPPGIKRNLQTVMFLVGPLIVYVISARISDFDIDEHFRLGTFVRIWPNSGDSVDLGSLKTLDDKGIKTVSSLLNQLMHLPGVQYGGPLPG